MCAQLLCCFTFCSFARPVTCFGVASLAQLALTLALFIQLEHGMHLSSWQKSTTGPSFFHAPTPCHFCATTAGLSSVQDDLFRSSFMDVYSAPDDETAFRVSSLSRELGAVTAESWPALEYERYLAIVDGVEATAAGRA